MATPNSYYPRGSTHVAGQCKLLLVYYIPRETQKLSKLYYKLKGRSTQIPPTKITRPLSHQRFQGHERLQLTQFLNPHRRTIHPPTKNKIRTQGSRLQQELQTEPTPKPQESNHAPINITPFRVGHATRANLARKHHKKRMNLVKESGIPIRSGDC